ncbi:hypothetical protein QN375_11425 [Pseudomonas sp. MH9.2]|uniref:hypothetical protein n=1 Tax=Pseudomonas sp. MH9.2 TaxID=3048629 RepID=UPI002AC8DF13|nr:hypothetical protein [Pseudomonas sp. MH9.2]MEB0026378.1 hypothetical protein [Pseudomonas sp. MH9.2]WPX67305.1 hypothetical protein RHM55_16185 [Pseudomonas sp. MH9.2]
MTEPKDNTDVLKVTPEGSETHGQTLARAHVMPENLSAAVLVSSGLVNVPVTDLARELRRQTEAVNKGDLTRAENMLLAQAHTLDALFANLATRAMKSKHMENLDTLFRLAFRAQNQSRATLQTLAELKAPKQIAFVKQANIGQNVQVNNGGSDAHMRTRNPKKAQNELLEAEHVQRLDTRATSTAIGNDSELATVGKQHRPDDRRR